jgi:hypothetical protein
VNAVPRPLLVPPPDPQARFPEMFTFRKMRPPGASFRGLGAF